MVKTLASTLCYSEEELLRSHDYARPQVEAGHRLHGGFTASGEYVPPRTLVRGAAIEAWSAALRRRGGDLLAADATLLEGIRYPNGAQLKLLLLEGLGQTFWDMLTITGHIEARGRMLVDMPFPEFADFALEDTRELAVGHLKKGLLRAHGLDEGGEPSLGVGGHDVMWFALRDLAFGDERYPDPVVPQNIARPEGLTRLHPALPEAPQRGMDFLLNLLLIEFRAELGFSLSEQLLRDPELFRARRAEAEHAAEIVGRIRLDEEIHVRSLRLYLGELQQLHFRGADGARIRGAELIDPLWRDLVHWATREQPKRAAAQQREVLTGNILSAPEGPRILAAFNALEDREAEAA